MSSNNVSTEMCHPKRNQISIQINDKGKCTNTAFLNMTELAGTFGVPASYPTKYIAYELGAQTEIDNKNEIYSIEGRHEASALQGLLDDFIDLYILCSGCKRSDTGLWVSQEEGIITRGCRSCFNMDSIEFDHKLNKFIIENPPNVKPAKQLSILPRNGRAAKFLFDIIPDLMKLSDINSFMFMCEAFELLRGLYERTGSKPPYQFE